MRHRYLLTGWHLVIGIVDLCRGVDGGLEAVQQGPVVHQRVVDGDLKSVVRPQDEPKKRFNYPSPSLNMIGLTSIKFRRYGTGTYLPRYL